MISNTPIHVMYHNYYISEIITIMLIVSVLLVASIAYIFRMNKGAILISTVLLLLCSLCNIATFHHYFSNKHYLSSSDMVFQAEHAYHFKYDYNLSSESKILPYGIKDMTRDGDKYYWVYLSGGAHVKCYTITIKDNYPYYNAYVKCLHK